MTKETQTVWRDKDGIELLVAKPNSKFYIPLSTVDKSTLIELAEACADAAKAAPEQEKVQ